MSEPILRVANLRKSFDGITALNDISFEIVAGDIVAVVGPNGAGKTTLFNLLTGYLTPSAGEIFYMNERITGWDPDQRVMAGISRSFQKTKLFFRFSVEENIRIASYLLERRGFRGVVPGQFRHERKDIQQHVDSIIDLVGLHQYRNYRASELSYGFQRRLEVGIAVSSKPKLLLLDEPFGGLSPENKSEMQELIRSLNRLGMTVIFIEHNMESVISCCCRMFAMDSGQLQVPLLR